MVVNPCVCCGEEAPEGSQVCWGCEHEDDNEKNKIKEDSTQSD
jgi:hypothetical protein